MKLHAGHIEAMKYEQILLKLLIICNQNGIRFDYEDKPGVMTLNTPYVTHKYTYVMTPLGDEKEDACMYMIESVFQTGLSS